MTKKHPPKKRCTTKKQTTVQKSTRIPSRTREGLADSAEHEANAVLLLKVQTLMVCLIR